MVDATMSCFWFLPTHANSYNLLSRGQGGRRVLELSRKIRSGADEWFSDVLNECRLGTLSGDNSNFLRGLPAIMPVGFWRHRRA